MYIDMLLRILQMTRIKIYIQYDTDKLLALTAIEQEYHLLAQVTIFRCLARSQWSYHIKLDHSNYGQYILNKISGKIKNTIQ